MNKAMFGPNKVKVGQVASIYKQALDSAKDFITITDPDGIVLYANPAAENITGFTPEEIIGYKVAESWQLPMPKSYYTKLWQTIKTKQITFEGDIRNRRKNGQEYDAHLTITPVFDHNHQILYLVGVERDVSRAKEIDRLKNEVVALTSHQLRTPPGIISWDLEELLRDKTLVLTKPQRQLLREIYRTNQRVIHLINSLLNASRIELNSFVIKPKELDIPSLIDTELSLLKSQLRYKKISLTKDYPKHFPLIKVDETIMGIILQNLLTNAIKYTSTGGSVSLRLTSQKRSFTIAVTDTGCGIPREQQTQIFNKLFRADNARRLDADGTGLGLYIIKLLLQQVGGTISFSSIQDHGTTFRINLPLNGMRAKVGSTTLVKG